MIGVPPPYSPAQATPEVLDRLIVGRDAIVRTLVSNLTSTVRDGGARFELITGPAGSGKTHLLHVVAHRLRRAVEGDGSIVTISDRRAVSSLADLFERILQQLGATEPGVEHERAASHRTHPFDAAGPTDIVDRLARQIDQFLASRPLVVFVEALGELLDTSESTQAAFRAHLQNRGSWSIVTTGRSVSPAFIEASSPLFGSFAIRPLEPLDAAECRSLLARRIEARSAGDGALLDLIQEPTGLARVHALRHLLGGWPRPMTLLEPLLDERRLDDLVSLIPWLADALQPELLAIREQLPLGRKAVFELLLDHGRPLNVTEIAASLFGVSPQNAASQLGFLRRSRLVHAYRFRRQSFYEIVDPCLRFVGLALSDPTRLTQLIRFLRSWYDAPTNHRDPDLGAFNVDQPGRTLFELDLTEVVGIDPEVVDDLRLAARARPLRDEWYQSAATAAVRQVLRSSAAERPVLKRCLEGVGAVDILDAVPEPSFG